MKEILNNSFGDLKARKNAVVTAFTITLLTFFGGSDAKAQINLPLLSNVGVHNSRTLDEVEKLAGDFRTEFTEALYRGDEQLDTLIQRYVDQAMESIRPGINSDYEEKSEYDIDKIKKILKGKKEPLKVEIREKTEKKLEELGLGKLADKYEKAFVDAFQKGYGEDRMDRELEPLKQDETDEIYEAVKNAVQEGFEDLAEDIIKALD